MSPEVEGYHTSGDKTWRVAEVILRTMDLPEESRSVAHLVEFNRDLEVDSNLFIEELLAPSQEFLDRVERADLQYPLLVDTEGHLIDGAHRLAKARKLNMVVVRVKVVNLNQIPPEPETET